MVQPVRSAAVDDLLSEPHQADEGAQSAGDHKTALETICQQVVSASQRIRIRAPYRSRRPPPSPPPEGKCPPRGWSACV